jgi:hypothetical protein
VLVKDLAGRLAIQLDRLVTAGQANGTCQALGDRPQTDPDRPLEPYGATAAHDEERRVLSEVERSVMAVAPSQGSLEVLGQDHRFQWSQRVDCQAGGLDHLHDGADHVRSIRRHDDVGLGLLSRALATDGQGPADGRGRRVGERIGAGEHRGLAGLGG